jgi:hypothetical protein
MAAAKGFSEWNTSNFVFLRGHFRSYIGMQQLLV